MPRLKFKMGVDPWNVCGELILAILVARDVYAEHGFDCVMTRLYDHAPNQLPNSLHNRDGICRAVDLRINHLPNELIVPIFTDIRTALPGCYDLVLEKDHIHLEYDRKGVAPNGGVAI